jgi:hypothetical protein
LRDWATCLDRAGYAGPACEVQLGYGVNHAAVMRHTGGQLVNELVCNEGRCTRELGRSLEHCQKKLTYAGACSLADWEAVWRWAGSPPLPITGRCAGAPSADCVYDADCGAGGVCIGPSSCDVYKFAPQAWEPCRCIQEAFVKPQIDEWLAEVRALEPAPSDSCAARAFNVIGEAVGAMIESACLDPTDPCCRAALDRCEGQWEAQSVRAHCHTCRLGPDDACPEHCDGAQIPCATWMQWCAAAKARFDPLRRASRQSPPEPAGASASIGSFHSK